MPDRTIILATNGRHGLRGLTQVNPQEFLAYQDANDDLTYTADTSAYGEGATLSTVTRTAYGPTVTNTSNTTTRITQRLKGFGYVDIKFTTSAGDSDQFRIVIEPRAETLHSQNYDPPIAVPLAYTATSDPTINDDAIDGHVPGTLWLNTATLNEFRCISNAAGAARWRHLPRILATSAVAASVTGTTSETILATINIPANALGSHGILAISDTWTHTNSANNKNLRARLGGISGTVVMNITNTTTLNYTDERRVQNRGATNSQTVSTSNGGVSGGYGAGTAALATPVTDTTLAFDLVLTGQLANSGETITLERYEVMLIRPDIS